jgi:integrase
MGRKKKKPHPQIPQEAEMQRFFKIIESNRDRAISRIIYHAGLRSALKPNPYLRGRKNPPRRNPSKAVAFSSSFGNFKTILI